jgi:hypothetical protein
LRFLAAVSSAYRKSATTIDASVTPFAAPLSALIHALVNAVTLVIQPAIGAIAPVVKAPFDTVAAAIEALCPAFQPGSFRPVRAPIEPSVNALAAVIEAGIDPVSAIVEALLDAIAAPVQPVFGPVSLVGERSAAEHQAGQHGNTQNRPVFHGPAPCGCVIRYGNQRGNRHRVDRARIRGAFIVKCRPVRQPALYLASSRASPS